MRVNGENNSFIGIILSENNFGVCINMGKHKFDRMKTIFGILMLVFAVVPLITVSASAQNSNTSSVGPMVGPTGPMVGPFGYYPPAPYGDSGDSEVVCGPYGCYWNEATAYIPKAIIADNGW